MVFDFPKDDVAKRLGLFDVQKVLEANNMQKNKKVCFTMLKPNERGLFR
jgi:hypothetical protein